MKYFKFKKETFPLVGFGSYRIGDIRSYEEDEIAAFEYGAYRHNMFLIDTAEMYGKGKSELVIGRFLTTQKREEWFIIDKILPENAYKGNFEKRCRLSLNRLGINQIDLYLLHWHGNVNLQDMVDEMENLVALGLIRHWGVSNFDVYEMEQLFQCKNGTHCYANQVLYNLISRGIEYDLIEWCKSNNILLIAYSPLGDDKERRDIMLNDINVKRVAIRHGVPEEAIALAFVIRNKNLIALVKSSSLEHIDNNMQALNVILDDIDLNILSESFPAPTHKLELEKI
jgi:diketogulonate reductase-like aldo/keto reductase